MPDKETGGRRSIDQAEQPRARAAKLERISRDRTTRSGGDEELDKAWSEWETTFDAIQDSIMLLDGEFNVVQANAATSRLLGRPLDEIIGKMCYKLVHGRDEPREGCVLSKTASTKKRHKTELYIPEKDMWTVVSADPILDEQGNMTGTVHIIRDITDRKKTEEALRESEGSFRNIFENAVLGLYRTTPDGRILMANSALLRMLGYASLEDLAERNLEEEGFAPEYPRSTFKQRIEADGRIVGLESAWTRRDGTKLFVRESAKAVRDAQGNTLYYEGTVEDITERKKAEQQVRQSEEKYKDLFESAREAIIIIDLNGKITDANRIVEEYGFKRDQLLGKSIFDFIPVNHRARAAKDFDELCHGTPVKGEMDVIGPKGNLTVEYRDNPIVRGGQIVAVQAILMDITERKKAQEKIKLFSDAIASAFDCFMLTDSKGNFTYANESTCKTFGYAPEEFLKLNITDLDADPAVAKNIAQDVTTKGKWSGEVINIKKNGETFYSLLSAFIIRDEQGNPKGTMGILKDITDRKKAEENIESLAKFPTENPNPVMRISKDGTVLYANEASKPLLRLWQCQEDKRLSGEWCRRIENTLEKGEPEKEEIECENKTYLLTFAPITDSAFVNVYALDITDRKKAEEEILAKQTQLKSLTSELSLAEERERRRIAAGIHDDIGQKLALAKLELQMFMSSAGDSKMPASRGPAPKGATSLEGVCATIDNAIEDCHSLTFELSNPALYELSFEAAIEQWLYEQIQKKHGIKCEVAANGDPVQPAEDLKVTLFRAIREVAVNVVKHAKATALRVSIERVGNNVQVTLADNGAGFAVDPAGAGLSMDKTGGFGLFNIKERLEHLGGNLKIESAPGRGTTITLTAPLEQQDNKQTKGAEK